MATVSIVMGSDSDMPVMAKAAAKHHFRSQRAG